MLKESARENLRLARNYRLSDSLLLTQAMTVNKTYQILKAEGFIKTDRRLGAFVAENINMDIEFREKLESELELLSAEASITGMDKEEFLKMCENIYSKMNPCTM